ncbi:hypothetical protein [Streptomyces albidoflavus]|uniref:hypothetical protein n=1 Tax=Streptomyces albidoflavus TaxID=1886 RepID=UPI00101ECB9E|nr:hypothetical protein [Streptomyces albidoflavus]
MRQGSQRGIDSDLALFSAVERQSGWFRGLLVARRVRPEEPASAKQADGAFVRIDAAEFARLTGACPGRVLAMWNAWERAAEDGVVPHAAALRPEMEPLIPDEDEVSWWGERGYYRGCATDGCDSQPERESRRNVSVAEEAAQGDAAASGEAEDSESAQAQAYIRAAQERMGGNPVADLDRADFEREVTDRVLMLKLEFDAVMRSIQQSGKQFSEHSANLLQAAYEDITATAGWISTVAKSGHGFDDQALRLFLTSDGGN